MVEPQEDLKTIHFFNRQSVSKRLLLLVMGGLILAGGTAGTLWAAEELYSGSLTPQVGAGGVGSLIALYLGFRLADQSRFEYVPTTAS